jgi:tagatose 1,6-diphosphate aldolase
MELSAGKLWGLRRLADDQGRFKMLAVDQRPPIKDLVASRRGVEKAPYEDVCAVKALLVDELGGSASAALLDPHYAYPAAVRLVRPSSGLLLTLEDSEFEDTAGGRRSSSIDDWSVEKIKRAGGDAVKVLAWYRPDAHDSVLEHQQAFVASVGEECSRFDIPFVFELLVYPMPGDAGHTTDYTEQPGKRADHVIESVETFAAPEFGIDLFKLESPLAAADVPETDADDAADVARLFGMLGEAAGRPWVMLSAGATKEAFRRVLHYAYAAGASGYLAGRAIWWDAFGAFPDLAAMRASLRADGVGYMASINALTDEGALPWHSHPCFGESGPTLESAGAGFRSAYPGFGGRG